MAGRRVRTRHGWLDHLVRAGIRFQQVDARRLAAAVTFSAFFAVFALALLGFAVLGYVVDQPVADQAVQRFFDEHLPQMNTEELRAARGTAGLVALVSLPVIGMMWVDALRSAIRAVWRIEEYPGRFPVRWAMNLLALLGLGLLLSTSLAVAFGAEALLEWLLDGVGQVDTAPSRWLLAAARFTLGMAVNMLLSIAVLTILPRLRIPLRRVLPAAALVTGGLELLTTLGRQLVARAEANPAFQLVAGAVGLLVFLLILNQLILFASAHTATGTRGRVTDLATGHPVGSQSRPDWSPVQPHRGDHRPGSPATDIEINRTPPPGMAGCTEREAPAQAPFLRHAPPR